MVTNRPISKRAEKILGKKIPVLDKGFVRLVDYMGNDTSIVQAARVSYGKGTRKVSTDRALVDYLLRHHHTTPFEMVEFKFHCKFPVFVGRQWVRHRTANINEISGRYSIYEDEFYLPKPSAVALQSLTNRQGREDQPIPRKEAQKIIKMWQAEQEEAYQNYEKLIDGGIARELARINLPQTLYTQWYWKIDLHNLLHFLTLRLDDHAQWEIREYAKALAKCVKAVTPWTWESFENHVLKAVSISGSESEAFKNRLKYKPSGLWGRRLREFNQKLIKLGLKKYVEKEEIKKG